ncbi:hypothetical protein TD95_001020 [Thielaviopsis punctulata]|uniref:Glycosyl transferase CAP10 domain-containing protein n=1 Tax=Thielaviopsis punctulata TaxID=72032 RepID=A0A0F4ZKG6_9PEZI|nr:hypothetical protein TD95_001020 [Thielaviopsis punctulata]
MSSDLHDKTEPSSFPSYDDPVPPPESASSLGLFRGRLGRRRRLAIVAVALLVVCFYSLTSAPSSVGLSYAPDGSATSRPAAPQGTPSQAQAQTQTQTQTQTPDLAPVSPNAHPIARLVNEAEISFQRKTQTQSKTLAEAVASYRQRYGIAPPPNFDKWFEFAQANDYQLIDEFDSIYHSLLPFWGLKPLTIRTRATEVLSHPNAMVAVSIRAGHVTYTAGSREWQINATISMLAPFVQYLPDMDLAFNVNDEPRIQVPHDDLARLVATGKDRMAQAAKTPQLKHRFSARPSDLNPGKGFTDVKRSRFNEFPHQCTWAVSRMSCAPESPARNLDDEGQDSLGEACVSDMCFIGNMTAFSDVCNSPSLATSYGFFVSPNAFTVSHDLIPVFSQSKYSTYADILYPSPWYWADKVVYNKSADMPWDTKLDSLYWRGSTTGGFSRWGGWRQHHRQRMVEGLSGVPAHAKVLANTGTPTAPLWAPADIAPGMLDGAVNVSFSHIGQCEPGDCDAQKDFFHLEKYAAPHDGWAHKFVLDIDGNAFSGRFYSFLQSASLPLKYAIAREWHADRIVPWLHYVPLTLRGLEWWEVLRWLRREDDGQKWAAKAAAEGQKWAAKALRKKDMEVWFFRLLLEYGRVVDDDRESIGFTV